MKNKNWELYIWMIMGFTAGILFIAHIIKNGMYSNQSILMAILLGVCIMNVNDWWINYKLDKIEEKIKNG